MSVGLPLVSVVIPTHQRRELLRRTLIALARQDLPSESFEVVVSIDRSADGTRELLGGFRASYELHVIETPRPGRAAACNAAIEFARREVLVILDDDMEPAPTLLSSHRRHHLAGTRVCVLGAAPIRTDAASPPIVRYVAAKFNLHLATLAQPGHAFVLRDFYSGNASIRRDVLLEVGGFDEAFSLYGNEDLELSLRLKNAGVELRFDAEAVAEQGYSKSFAELAQNTFEKGETAVLFARKHPEAFDGLQLATYNTGSARWLGVRALLLALTRRLPRTQTWALRLAEAVERFPAAQRPLFYRFALDYFYWAGVSGAVAGPPAGPLAQLAVDIRRGPIDLLLHR